MQGGSYRDKKARAERKREHQETKRRKKERNTGAISQDVAGMQPQLMPGLKLDPAKWNAVTGRNDNAQMVEVADVFNDVATVRLYLPSGAWPLFRLPVEEVERMI
jgi:hypothetical protein